MFQGNLQTLQKKSIEGRKQWLVAIWQGRILMDPHNLIHDNFETSETLQKWLGISYTISGKEAQPSLEDAILQERELGLGNLPIFTYQTHFDTTLQTIFQNTIENLKSWLLEVRHRRTLYYRNNLIHDEFNTPGALRNWIEE